MYGTIYSKKAFIKIVKSFNRNVHGHDYLKRSMTRQYLSYKIAFKCLKPKKNKILSIGAGGAYPETVLLKKHDSEIHVLDYEGMIQNIKEFYDNIGFIYHECNIDVDPWSVEPSYYDLVFSLDNIEHSTLPTDIYIKNCFDCLKPGGHLVLSTDNIANIKHILKLLLGKSFLHSTRELFSPVDFLNEHIHRRLFTFGELKQIFESTGFSNIKCYKTWQNQFHTIKQVPFVVFELFLFWLRPNMVISAQKI